jgi:hypothetical protein
MKLSHGMQQQGESAAMCSSSLHCDDVVQGIERLFCGEGQGRLCRVGYMDKYIMVAPVLSVAVNMQLDLIEALFVSKRKLSCCSYSQY